MISRRALLAAAATAAAPQLVLGAPAPVSLGDAAAAGGLLYGASIGQEAFDDPGYANLYRRQTRILTTDVAMKFDWLRPAPDRFEFSYADAVVRFAADSGKPLRGHTLIWNDRAPDWLKRLPSREVERVFDAHIDRVVERYAGKLVAWDVVNEPFWPMDGRPGGWRDGPWFAAMGPSYVERAFRRVAAIDKTARLALNEAQCDNDHEWGRSIRPLLAGLVDRLLDAGAPLDTIGLQSHLRPQGLSRLCRLRRPCRRLRQARPVGVDHRIRHRRFRPARRFRGARPRRRGGRREVPQCGPRRPGGRHGGHLAIVGSLLLVSRDFAPRAAPAALRRRPQDHAAWRSDGRRFRRRAATGLPPDSVNASYAGLIVW